MAANNLLPEKFSGAMDAIDYFESSPDFAIAVSGGADSMALLLLAHTWAKKHGRRVIALTVDHGLRKESASEAKQVSEWCKNYGIEHHILNWRPKHKTTQADARDARYELLTEWCREYGVQDLLTAHHRGDQAETLFFRLARGSNLRGLACISPISEMNGIRLVRPLLGIGKSDLMHYLRDHPQPWLEDPSNQSPKYTRNTLRAALNGLPNAEEIELRAANVAEAFGHIRTLIDQKTDEAFKVAVQLHNGSAEIDAPAFAALPQETALLLAGRLIRELNGDDHPPRTEKLERLCRWLASPDSKRATLAHLAFTYSPKQQVFRVSQET